MKSQEAAEALTYIKECFLGLWLLKNKGEDVVECYGQALALLVNALNVLDFYLTESLECRKPTDGIELARMLADKSESRFLLSDSSTMLVLRFPTEKNLKCVSLKDIDVANIQTHRKWVKIDRDSQSIFFTKELIDKAKNL